MGEFRLWLKTKFASIFLPDVRSKQSSAFLLSWQVYSHKRKIYCRDKLKQDKNWGWGKNAIRIRDECPETTSGCRGMGESLAPKIFLAPSYLFFPHFLLFFFRMNVNLVNYWHLCHIGPKNFAHWHSCHIGSPPRFYSRFAPAINLVGSNTLGHSTCYWLTMLD